MDFEHFNSWDDRLKDCDFLFIAGPCSAETEEQILITAKELDKLDKVRVFRSGIWKPRTTPGSFEGVGDVGLDWMRKVKEQTKLLTATEVAKADHVESVLSSQAIDIIWLGARTVGNPFSVQEIADALRGVDIPVMVKNPIYPDLKLWIGAIERLYKAGIRKIAAIHRGFFPFMDHRLRNIPKWEIPIDLKTEFPSLPIIGDPSHIAGNRSYLEEIAQKALDLDFDGLMIEVHPNPDNALSDSKQQLTPKDYEDLLKRLKIKKSKIDQDYISQLEKFRMQIDSIDYQVIELLAQRMQIVKKIGEYKNDHNISIFQLDRWKEIIISRIKFGIKNGLDKEFIRNFIELIHKESINQQIKVKNNGKKAKK